MAIAALVLGILSAICAFIPLCGYFAIIPAIVGLILGIVSFTKESKAEDGKKGMSIAGIILNALALVIIIIYTILIVGAAKSVGNEINTNDLRSLQNDLGQIEYDLNSVNY